MTEVGRRKVGRGVGERRPQGCAITPWRRTPEKERNEERYWERKGRCGPLLPPLVPSGLWLDCFLSDLEVEVGEDGEHGHSREEFGQHSRRSGVNLHCDSHLQHSIREPESCRPSKMIVLSPSIRPSDRINQTLLKAIGPPPSNCDVAKIPLYRPVTCCWTLLYEPLVQKCAKCNKSVIVFGSSSEPGTRAARRKLCFQVKLVSWHVISWGEFLIHDLMKICQSPSCYRFSHPVTSLSRPAPICFLPPCLSSGYAVLKKVKDSRCGTPLLLNQLPHQCIILPNLTSLLTQSLSLPTALTPSPPPTRFFSLFFSSLSFIPAAQLGSVAHQLQQQ